MQPIWAVLIALVIFFLVFRMRQRRRRVPEEKVYARRVEGFQVSAFLHPRASAACLADHGVQFGKGFRRKEGPALPHDGLCQCRAAPFSFTSNEVFQGALRRSAPPRVSIPGLSEDDAAALLELLRAWNQAPPAGGAALASVDWTRFSPGHREALETFLRERLEFTVARDEPKTISPA